MTVCDNKSQQWELFGKLRLSPFAWPANTIKEIFGCKISLWNIKSSKICSNILLLINPNLNFENDNNLKFALLSNKTKHSHGCVCVPPCKSCTGQLPRRWVRECSAAAIVPPSGYMPGHRSAWSCPPRCLPPEHIWQVRSWAVHHPSCYNAPISHMY